jgi:hypothetical protein
VYTQSRQIRLPPENYLGFGAYFITFRYPNASLSSAISISANGSSQPSLTQPPAMIFGCSHTVQCPITFISYPGAARQLPTSFNSFHPSNSNLATYIKRKLVSAFWNNPVRQNLC